MASENTCYKPSFTNAEIDEAIAWFEKNMDQLPASMTIGSGITIPDLKLTVEEMIIHLRERAKENNTYCGQFSLLLEIRKRAMGN
jgi:hypothetical protein